MSQNSNSKTLTFGFFLFLREEFDLKPVAPEYVFDIFQFFLISSINEDTQYPHCFYVRFDVVPKIIFQFFLISSMDKTTSIIEDKTTKIFQFFLISSSWEIGQYEYVVVIEADFQFFLFLPSHGLD